jgi:hypothetical protein
VLERAFARLCSEAQLDVFHNFLLQMQRRPPSVCSSGLEGTDEESAKSFRIRSVRCHHGERAHFSRSAYDY